MSTPVSPTTPIGIGPNYYSPPVDCTLCSHDFEKIMRLLTDNPTKDLNQMLAEIFSKLGVTEWSDLMVESPEAVIEAYEDLASTKGYEMSGNTMKKLKYIVKYARTNDKLGDDITFRHVMQCVDLPTSTAGVVALPITTNNEMVTQINEKALPKLEKFSGNDKDFVRWRNMTLHAFGKVGLKSFLLDEGLVSSNPKVAESVFYALSEVTIGGNAGAMVENFHMTNVTSPAKLWKAIEEYYNTNLNTAGVVISRLRELLTLKLTADITATKFIERWRRCTNRLRETGAGLGTCKLSQQALLLVAIQDDDYDCIRDSIIKEPDRDIELILREIRDREASLGVKNGTNDLRGDGLAHSKVRRTTVDKNQNGKREQKTRYETKGDNKKNLQWNVPRLPDDWKAVGGEKLFQTMLAWRRAANVDQLNQETLVNKYKYGNYKRKNTDDLSMTQSASKYEKTKHSRRSKVAEIPKGKKHDKQYDQVTDEETSRAETTDDESVASKKTKHSKDSKSRIYLGRSRRVRFE
jgi:hypothetical protein